MANIYKDPTFRANLGYNGFDMSHSIFFSSTTGELLPVFYDLLQPGDKVSLNHIIKSRTNELASAAMTTIREHVEWFFVPMTQIYSAFGDFYYQIQDLKSSLMNPQNIDGRIPFFTPANFLTTTSGLLNLDQFGYKSTPRLLDWFYPYTGQVANEGTYNLSSPTGFCPIFMCAYQKIFMDFYRDSNRESNDPRCYNLDSYYANNSIPAADFKFFATLRYRPIRKDYFTHLFVSPLFGSGDISSFNYSENSIYNSFRQWVVNATELGLTVSNNFNSYQGQHTTPTPVAFSAEPTAITQVPRLGSSPTTAQIVQSVNAASSALSPSAIRTAFAVQKLMEITRRAGKHYDKQTLAHFGVDVPTGISGEVVYIGGSESVINIGDVIATATSSAGSGSSVLGQVAGKGYGYGNGKNLNFVAPCHGILMCVYSSEVDNNYNNLGINKLNLLMSREDWFSPEYDNLGMQPLFSFETPYFDASDNSTYYNTLGWQYRYSELKTRPNKIYGALSYNGTLDYWTTSNDNYIMDSTGKLDVRCLYVSPNALDNIMLVRYNTDFTDPAPQNTYWTDPLIHEIYFDVKKSSKMSTYGLEQL